MYQFNNATSIETYKNNKKYIRFEYVPNTAAGAEHTRAYVISHGWKYFLSAINERDYFLSCDDYSVWFTMEGDKITVNKAHYKNRTEQAARSLKKYAMVLSMAASCIKYDNIVSYCRA